MMDAVKETKRGQFYLTMTLLSPQHTIVSTQFEQGLSKSALDSFANYAANSLAAGEGD